MSSVAFFFSSFFSFFSFFTFFTFFPVFFSDPSELDARDKFASAVGSCPAPLFENAAVEPDILF